MKHVGKSVPRYDAWQKVTGEGCFTSDVFMPGMLFAKVLRSPHAHARIKSIDTSAAEALPGVKAVATYKNSPDTPFSTSAGMWFHPHSVRDQRIFDSKVRYVGDEVAAVAATTEAIAQEAIKLIKVDYEILPMMLDPFESMREDSALIHDEMEQVSGHNVGPMSIHTFKQGDFEKGWAEGHVFADAKCKTPIQKPAQMETMTAMAWFKGNGELQVCSTTQTPHPSKMILALIFGLPQSKVRVYSPPYIGGGFGCRIGLSGKAEPIAAVLSKLSGGSPVKLVYSREEDFLTTDTRHSGYIHFKAAANKEGKLTAIWGRVVLNTGAYLSYGIDVPAVLAINTLSTYSCHNLDYQGRSMYTNILPAGAMRGFGTPQGAFCLDECMDDLAKQLNMDAAEFKKINARFAGDEWFIPYPVTSSVLPECIDKAKAAIGWDQKRGKAKSGKIRRGVGIGCGAHGSNSYPSIDYSAINMRLEADGSLHFGSAIPDMGSGASTTQRQIAADALGIDIDQVHMSFADTETAPWEIGGHASRTLYSTGLIVIKACEELKAQILQYAIDNMLDGGNNSNPYSKLLCLDYRSLYIADGMIFGAPRTLSVAEVALHAHNNCKRFLVSTVNRPISAPPFQCHAAEVEVDMETGEVKVLKLAAAHDSGIAINPQIVEGQIEGGVAMGVGYATREEMLFDPKTGKCYSGSYHKYMIPTFQDMPEIDTIICECNDPSGPFGAKSVGECGLVPTAAAIASAVEDAIGIRFSEFPLTPSRVKAKIDKVYGKNGEACFSEYILKKTGLELNEEFIKEWEKCEV